MSPCRSWGYVIETDGVRTPPSESSRQMILADKSGKISAAEATKLVQTVAPNTTEEQVRNAMKSLDKDQDGELSKDEVSQLVSKIMSGGGGSGGAAQ